MLEELLAITIGSGMALLTTFKSDQQSIIILKGKLSHSDADKQLARQMYKKYARKIDVVLATVGLSMLSLAIAMFANRSPLFYVPSIVGLAFAGVGVWGRCKTFLAADRELDGIVKVHRSSRGAEKD